MEPITRVILGIEIVKTFNRTSCSFHVVFEFIYIVLVQNKLIPLKVI
jgi:hypothetical protein